MEKKIDKNIIKTLIGISLMAITIGLVFYTKITVQTLGGILLCAYLIFIIFHLGLLLPVIYVGFFIDNWLIDFEIREKSVIIHNAIVAIGLCLYGVVAYFLIPCIISAMIQYTLDIGLILKAVGEAMN